jgi:hypothetical protein
MTMTIIEAVSSCVDPTAVSTTGVQRNSVFPVRLSVRALAVN